MVEFIASLGVFMVIAVIVFIALLIINTNLKKVYIV
jgi:hypothetical protein